jgi:hypothetical protein
MFTEAHQETYTAKEGSANDTEEVDLQASRILLEG